MRASWPELMEKLNGCTGCRLCQGRTNIVPGEGNPNADLMFVGEGPGQEEDRQGRPFVGPSGELLTKMIHAIGMERSECYIANVVKCRPPGNRNPAPDEAAACLDFLRAQTLLVRPKIIVLLGKVAAQTLLREEIFITRDHGVWFERKGIYFMPTYHPAALIRDPGKKRDAWEDFKKVRDRLGMLKDGGETPE
jgi:uracil-DNA glycosylase family 4